MPEHEYDLVIVPTAGCKNGKPSVPGALRFIQALQHCHRGDANVIAVIGGRREKGPSEAQAYYDWASIQTADTDLFVKLVSGEALCSARDLLAADAGFRKILAATDKEPTNARIGVVTYWEHFVRIRTTLQFLGYNGDIEWVKSGEIQAYHSIIEAALIAVTSLDPLWTWLGLPLIWQASKRAHLTDTSPPST